MTNYPVMVIYPERDIRNFVGGCERNLMFRDATFEACDGCPSIDLDSMLCPYLVDYQLIMEGYKMNHEEVDP